LGGFYWTLPPTAPGHKKQKKQKQKQAIPRADKKKKSRWVVSVVVV
jgi:hypothetical protein